MTIVSRLAIAVVVYSLLTCVGCGEDDAGTLAPVVVTAPDEVLYGTYELLSFTEETWRAPAHFGEFVWSMVSRDSDDVHATCSGTMVVSETEMYRVITTDGNETEYPGTLVDLTYTSGTDQGHIWGHVYMSPLDVDFDCDGMDLHFVYAPYQFNGSDTIYEVRRWEAWKKVSDDEGTPGS